MVGSNDDESIQESPRFSRRRILQTTAAVGISSTVGATSGLAQESGGEVLWEFETGSAVWSSPTVVNGTVYVASSDSIVYALDADTGNEQWRFQTEQDIEASPTVVDGTVFIGSTDWMVYALDADSGEEQWRFETDDDVLSSPTVGTDAVYVGSNDNTLYALDRASGEERWRYETERTVSSSPTVVDIGVGTSDETVFVGSKGLHAVDAESGEQVWQAAIGNVDSSPTVTDLSASGGWSAESDSATVFVGSDNTRVHAIKAESGDVQWEFTTDGNITSSPTVAEGTIFAGSTAGGFHAIDAESGEERWSVDIGKRIDSSPTVVTAGEGESTVFVGSGDRFGDEGIVFAFGVESGDERWQFTADNQVWASPTVSDGTLYVGSADNTVYALDAGVDGSSAGSRVLWGTLGHHEDLRQLRDAPQADQSGNETQGENQTASGADGGGLPFAIIGGGVAGVAALGGLGYLLVGRDDEEEEDET